jgi:hypothetical protein
MNDNNSHHQHDITSCSWEWHPSLVAKRWIVAKEEEERKRKEAFSTGGHNNNAHEELDHDQHHQQKQHLERPVTILRQRRRYRREKQSEYRRQPLEEDHDMHLIPNTHLEDIADAIPSAIERERLIETNVSPLMCGKRIWKTPSVEDYIKAHPYEASLQVTPDDWILGDDQDRNLPWPNGCPYESSVFRLCWSFFVFVYNKNRALSNRIIVYEIICSWIPPITSYLFGTGLIDQTTQKRYTYVYVYAALICILNTFGSWLQVYYSNKIPTGGTRTALRDTLFKKLQSTTHPHLKDKLTPGAVSSIVCDKVQESVSIYNDFLTFPVSMILWICCCWSLGVGWLLSVS